MHDAFAINVKLIQRFQYRFHEPGLQRSTGFPGFFPIVGSKRQGPQT